MPGLHCWSPIRPHPLKRHPTQPPPVLITNTPSPVISTCPHNTFWLRNVCRINLLRIPLLVINRALGLQWVDGLVCRCCFAYLQVGTVERQICFINVRIASREECLVLIDISNWVTLSKFIPLRDVKRRTVHTPFPLPDSLKAPAAVGLRPLCC